MIELFRALALSLGIALLIGSLFNYWHGEPIYWVYYLVFILAAIVFLSFHPIWKIDEKYISRYLDNQFPQLEDSSALLLKEPNELGLLEGLQVAKIVQHLPLQQVFKPISSKIFIALAWLIAGAGVFMLLEHVPSLRSSSLKAEQAPKHKVSVEKVLPQVASYHLSIVPPTYTGNAPREQTQFTLKVETGAKVSWNIRTNKPVQSFYMIFNGEEKFKLNPTGANATEWSFSKQLDKQGFYQLELDGVKSDLYQIDIIPDFPVNIKILQPKPQTVIDVGMPTQIDLKALLSDDYGITEAFISATRASGKGESVSFTEKKINFNVSFKGAKSLTLNKHIDLKNLGMKPGDELYFFIQAKDNKGQQSRSDVYTVSIVDTAELMSMAGMTSGVNLVPEYFRSQRQIILDTEKLLAEKASIAVEEFKKRSNTLGIDQKLLRLKYGQFLGEENETEIGGDHDDHNDNDGHDHGKQDTQPEKFGDVQALMDKYAHKHDIAEDATFFEPEIKAQLKAVLNEMWSAELKLRTYAPEDALPFEYKALRLLKDLQQKSRVYVAKTTVKTAAIKPEKRLTGELKEITAPQQNLHYELKDHTKEELKLLLALLDLHKNGKPFSANDQALLQSGEKQIIIATASHPASYLPALKSLRRLSAQKLPALNDLNTVSNAIYNLIGTGTSLPQAQTKGLSKKLAEHYFNHLKGY
ncbi:DUF4175 domain-containing protein [Pedobacter montanisoli]|uniref:DUF4175 domain-containing protein n=1 Tax=Pedobacter montanisoli TaxID=2923277 RepID=A0ABS9ZZ98_9SPHI|nr:DUF4175 domain-containing protein [Pedobacter montanisoli]MCJ0743641.1 DUF4175 domain-containing protein [Pedobacter montanisoli]